MIALLVAGSGDETRADLEYVDQLQGQAMELSVGGDSLRDVVSRLSRIDRTELVTVVDGLRGDIAVGMELVAEGPPSDPLFSVNALYRQALEAWDTGVGGFGSGLLAAADNPANSAVVDIVANSLAEMRAGDQLYTSLVAELGREDVPSPVAPMPRVVLMPAEGELFSLAQAYVEAARSPNNGLALSPGLAVSQIIPTPDWTVDPEGQVVVPNTDQILFSVVVTNSGNVVSLVETIRLQLTGGPDDFVEEAEIGSLQPGAQTTIVFGPMPVEGGAVYEVTATIIVQGNDSNPDDNEISVVFTVNEG